MAKKLRFLLTLLFIMAATLSWGEEYKIVFKTSTKEGSSLGDKGVLTEIVDQGIEYVSSVGGSANCISQYGFKIGTASKAGYITINLNEKYQDYIKSIKIVSKAWDEKENCQLSLTINGQNNAIKTGIVPGDDFEYKFDSPTQVKSVKIETSDKKRAFVSSVVLVNEPPVAAIGTTKYTTLQAAFNAAKTGETVTLLKDVDATSAMYSGDSRYNLWIKSGITVDGTEKNYTITVKGRGIGVQGASENIDVTFKNVTVKNVGKGKEDGRCVDTRGKIGSLTLDNATLTTAESTYTGYLQPLTIGGNQKDVATVTIRNSNIVVVDGANKGYGITTFNPVNMTIDGSTIKGWACFNIKEADNSAGSKGSKITVTNSTLVSANGTPGYSNAYSLIKIEDDNVSVDITGSTLNVNGGDNTQSIVSFQKKDLSSSANSIVSLGDGNNVTLEGDFNYSSSEGETSKLVISGGIFNQPVPEQNCAEGMVPCQLGENKYSVRFDVEVAAPVVFHDSGAYDAGLSVPMYAQAGAKIYYTTDGSEPTTASTEYTGALTIENATTLNAIAVLDGVASAVVTRVYTIAAKAEKVTAFDGYYSIKNGTGKYINVAGRKTVTFVADDDKADKAGTVIKVKTNDKGQVEVLRSQGVDLPGYAKKAMNYVPEIVQLVVNKLDAEGSGKILGENGLKKIMDKFNKSFDYNLYLEKAGEGYRIYGKTPSMKPVVDFYAENKANVDIKLPQLEAFINSAIQKVLQKTGGRGASILKPFSLVEIWEKMGSKLTKPVDEASTAKFYEEVLSSEANVWNFAYQTAMKYWEPLIKHDKVQQNLDQLGDMAKYLEKVKNIRPDFKYYIVANEAGNDVDFISQGNIDIQNNAARATWTLDPRTDFKVTFDPENVKNGGTEYYATLYTDFGYKLAEGMKAYKVAAVDDKGYAKLEEIKATQIPAQTPVLLMTTDLTKTTVEVADGGEKITGENLLVGPDYLINEYQIKTAQVVTLFDMAKEILGESAYNTYVQKYEHLMLKNSGTVNNKYFFGLPADDLKGITDLRVLGLNDAGMKLGFYGNWTNVKANEAFIINANNPVKLTKIPDVNRDGKIDVNDVTATVDIVLGRDSAVPYKFDHDAADVNNSNSIDVNDVTGIVDIVLGTKTIE